MDSHPSSSRQGEFHPEPLTEPYPHNSAKREGIQTADAECAFTNRILPKPNCQYWECLP